MAKMSFLCVCMRKLKLGIFLVLKLGPISVIFNLPDFSEKIEWGFFLCVLSGKIKGYLLGVLIV